VSLRRAREASPRSVSATRVQAMSRLLGLDHHLPSIPDRPPSRTMTLGDQPSLPAQARADACTHGSAAIDAVPSDVRFRSKSDIGGTHICVRSMNSRRLMGFPEHHRASSIAGQGGAESEPMSELGHVRRLDGRPATSDIVASTDIIRDAAELVKLRYCATAMIIQMSALHSVAPLIGLCRL